MAERQEVAEMEGAEAIRDAGIELVGAARRSVHIYSRDLDPHLYDNSGFLEAMTRFLTGHPRAEARVIVQQPAKAVRDDNRLIDLARRLSSRFEIREPGPQHREYNAAFLVVDAGAVLYRELGDRFEAQLHKDNRALARQLIRYHTEVWEFGQRNVNLRALDL